MNNPIYLDNNATTRPSPAALAAVADALAHTWANPSSPHPAGEAAKMLLGQARMALARLLGVKPPEVVFTSGATEGNHMALRGALARPGAPQRVVLSAIEHAGQQALADQLAREGVDVVRLPVDARGQVRLAGLEETLAAGAALLSIMAANNETGVLQPVAEAGAIARRAGVPFHVDATQQMGKLPVDPAALGADLLTLSAHKFHGPKGVGALVLRKGLDWPAFITGSQERRRRGGTENLPGIVGMAAAAAEVPAQVAAADAIAALRDRLEDGIRARFADVRVFGAGAPRLPNTSCLRIGTLEADAVLIRLGRAGICAAMGSACSSGGNEPSHVLLAMGVSRAEALCALRFSLSGHTTAAEIEQVLEALPAALAPLYTAA